MSDPLADLRDWHLPDPVSWWPPAPGWWLLAGLGLLAVAAVWHWWRRRWHQGAAARCALDELAALRRQLDAGLDAHGFAAAVSVLLRRLALTRYPRGQVAGLTGSTWLAFLDSSGGGDGFTQGPGQVLAELPYRPAGGGGAEHRPAPAMDADALADLAARWIRAHQGAIP